MIATPCEVGDAAPDVTLLDQDVREVSFAAFWREMPTAFIFLRHFACPHCRAQVVELAQSATELASVGLQVVLIGLGSPAKARQFREDLRIDFPVLIDVEKQSYRAYSLLAKNPFRQHTPHTLKQYVADWRVGGGTGISLQQDMMQLGGTFVVDTDGIVRFAQRSERIGERPTTTMLVQSLPQHHAVTGDGLASHDPMPVVE